MTFTIDSENNITVHGTPEEAAATAATPFDTFSSQQELAELAAQWPAARLVAIWNSLPGVTPVKKFKDRKAAVTRIWKRIQGLDEPAKSQTGTPAVKDDSTPAAPPAKPKPGQRAKGGARAAKGASSKGKASMKARRAKGTPKAKGKKAGKVQPTEAEPSAPRGGSKTAEVIGMLQRKNGATITEIITAMGWQKHTVRGFMAGAMKKAGYTVESFKSDKGERTYRINK